MLTSRSNASTKPFLNPSKYRLLGLVGQGQFGQVFCAVHRQTGQLVALKNLEQKRFPTHQFLRELRFLLSLQHTYIVTCYAIEHTKTGRYLVMDYCEGGTLRGLMTEVSHLRLESSLRIIANILEGLNHAHKRGIIHCDIKPENILLQLEAKGWIAKISDFGVARLSQELSQHGGSSNTGSPAYMSPERFYGQYSQTSDLYSVGIMLFEIVAGYRPFSGTPGALMNAHLNQVVTFPDSVPDPLRPVIKTSLEKLSARRYSTATAMLNALLQASEAMGINIESQSFSLETPLLKSHIVPVACSFQAQSDYQLKAPILHLGHLGSGMSPHPVKQADSLVFFAGDTEVGIHYGSHSSISLPVELSATDGSETPNKQQGVPGVLVKRSAEQWRTIRLPEKIHGLMLHPHNCWALTAHAIYRIPHPAPQDAPQDPVVIHQFDQDCLVAMDRRGRWAAAVTDMRQVIPKSGFSTLSFYPLSDRGASRFLAPKPIRLMQAGQASSLLQAIAIDGNHVAIFSDLAPSSSTHQASSGIKRHQKPPIHHASGTHIEIVARRGKRIGALSLPILLGHVVQTQTPYRFLATDQYDLYSILQIDLKPFRVSRFVVQVIPKFIAAARWGYLVMNQQGHMILLDQSGCQVNRIEGPPNPTAIALTEPSGVLIATWKNNQGHLYTVDLKSLDIDIVL